MSLPHTAIPTFRCSKLGVLGASGSQGPFQQLVRVRSGLRGAVGEGSPCGELPRVHLWLSSWGCLSVYLSLAEPHSMRLSGSLSQPSDFAFPCLLSTRLLGSLPPAGFLLQLSASISGLLSPPLPGPCSCVLFIYCVCFPLAVKDLDTEKYFHLVSALPPALGVPAPHWEWTWPPAALGLWRLCSQAWGRPGWGVCGARRPRVPGRASQGLLPGASADPAPASQVLPTDELAEPKKSHRQSHRKKVLPEIYLTRLLSTKVRPAPHRILPPTPGVSWEHTLGEGGTALPLRGQPRSQPLSAGVTEKAVVAQQCPRGHMARGRELTPQPSNSFRHSCAVGFTNPFHRQEHRGPERLGSQPEATQLPVHPALLSPSTTGSPPPPEVHVTTPHPVCSWADGRHPVPCRARCRSFWMTCSRPS